MPPGSTDHASATPDFLAQMAWRRAQTAIERGETAEAMRWLDRACRLAPGHAGLELEYATAKLARDPACAATLFAQLSAKHDMWEIWIGLAGARRLAGDASGAASALGCALARHAARQGNGWVALADAVAPDGWCALAGDGVMRLGPAHDMDVDVTLDRRTMRPGQGLRLPLGWETGQYLHVMRDGRDLVGSPIDIRALRRLEGIVAWEDGFLTGWAWHPNDPMRDPVLTVCPASGPIQHLVASDVGVDALADAIPGRRRRFRMPAVRVDGPFRVLDRHGVELPGSPVDPAAEQRVFAARPPPRATPRQRAVDVVVPVFAGVATTLACLDSVLTHRSRGTRLIVVDDASPEPHLVAALDRLAARGRILLLRHATNRGFAASANTGIAAAEQRDVVLLNSDTLVAAGWVERLRMAAYAAPEIGAVCPLSNDATILSYPDPAGRNAMPDRAETDRLAALAARANTGAAMEIPTVVGFCVYLRRDCLDAVGLFRSELFVRGYGEENDFSMRARAAGWRHVAAPGVFVAHEGGASFKALSAALQWRNRAVLERLHPEYADLIATHITADPLFPARRRLDLARWDAARRNARPTVLLVTHGSGGGVQRAVEDRITALRAEGARVVLLRPGPDGGAVSIGGADAAEFPNLRFALPDELPAFLRLLRREKPAFMEYHHPLGHHPVVLDLPSLLGVPHEMRVHDYVWFCPRLVLSGAKRHYCGEPDLAGCKACVLGAGSMLGERISVASLHRRSAALLRAARRVVVPCEDVKMRMIRQFPGLKPQVVAPEDDHMFRPPAPMRQTARRRVVVVGAIGPEKGVDVLLDAARDAAARDLPLEFVVVGHTSADAALIETGRVFVTGPYDRANVEELIRAQQSDLGFLPSVVPETWCYSLTEAWCAGLMVAVFDLGAQADRVRQTGRGWVLPPGLAPEVLNHMLLAVHW